MAPIAGGAIAAFFFTKLIEPAMKKQSEGCNCN
jgi:hypothetical protein